MYVRSKKNLTGEKWQEVSLFRKNKEKGYSQLIKGPKHYEEKIQ